MAAVVEHLPEIGVTIISHWIFNAYVIHDGGEGRPFVVDVGLPRTANDIARALTITDQRPEEIAAVVATHGHADHLAGVPHLHETAAGRLMLPAKDRDYAAGETPRSPGPREIAEITPVWGDQPFDMGALVELAKVAGDIGFDARGWKMPIEPKGYLSDGTTLPGAPDWRIIATPGHTDDSTSLYCSRTRTLLSGDAVLAVGRRAWCNPEYVDSDLSEQTEKRLRELDVEVLLPGHGRAVAGPRVMQEALSFRERPPGERPGLMRYLRSHRGG